MHLTAHAAAGWGLGEAVNGSRRLRVSVLLAAVAPDVDVVSYAWGELAFGYWHHRVTHSLLFSLIITCVAIMFSRRDERWKTLVLTQLAFYTHYFGDYFLTQWPLMFFYPFSTTEYGYGSALSLYHPVNQALNVTSLAVFLVLGVWRKRTVLEAVWPRLDRRVCHLLFHPKSELCNVCGAAANEVCEECGGSVCSRHAPLHWRMRTVCVNCRGEEETGGKLGTGDLIDPWKPGKGEP